MEKEYDIPSDDQIREDVKSMCNLSQGILERGEARGEAKFILKMYEKGYTLEQIADVAEKSVDEVRSVIDKKSCH